MATLGIVEPEGAAQSCTDLTVARHSRPYGCPILVYMARMATMKTTLDIHDELLTRAKRHAKETGQPLRAVVEDGLRRVLVTANPRRYKLPDLRVGDADAPDPLATYSWPELRELIYGDSGAP